MQNLKRSDTNELIYKPETDSQTRRAELGVDMHILLYLKRITSRVLLHDTGNSAQCYVAAWMGGHFGGEWIHVCI